jgi:hypothetical protein
VGPKKTWLANTAAQRNLIGRNPGPKNLIGQYPGPKKPDWLKVGPKKTWLAETPAQKNLIGRNSGPKKPDWPIPRPKKTRLAESGAQKNLIGRYPGKKTWLAESGAQRNLIGEYREPIKPDWLIPQVWKLLSTDLYKYWSLRRCFFDLWHKLRHRQTDRQTNFNCFHMTLSTVEGTTDSLYHNCK